ncbi:hypothetical protein EJB05_15005, partial [Eragrostis curvula]
MGREHSNSRPRTAHAQQLAAEENIVWKQEMMLRQAAAADTAELTGNQNMLAMVQLQQAVGGQPHQNMMGLDATQVSATVEVVAREQGLMMMQQQQQAAAYEHPLPGATNMAFHQGGSADAEAFLVQPQKVNALAYQTEDSSLPPSVANSPCQQQVDGGDDDDKLSDLTAVTM